MSDEEPAAPAAAAAAAPGAGGPVDAQPVAGADLAPVQVPPPRAAKDSDKWEEEARAPEGSECGGVCCFEEGELPGKFKEELGTHWIRGARATMANAREMGTFESLDLDSLKVQETPAKFDKWQHDEVRKKCLQIMRYKDHLSSSKKLKSTTIRSGNQQIDHPAITATKAFMTMVSYGGYRNLNQPQLIALRDTTHPGALPLEVHEMPMLVDYNWYHAMPKERKRECMLLLVFARGGEIAAEMEATGEGADTTALKEAFEKTAFYTPHLTTAGGIEVKHKLKYDKHGAILAQLYRDLMDLNTPHNTLSDVFEVCKALFKTPALWDAYQPQFAVRSKTPLLAVDFQRDYCTEPVRPTSLELGLACSQADAPA